MNAEREAKIPLHLRGPGGSECDVDVLVDTGFTGSLALPHQLIATMGLEFLSEGHLTLADGSDSPSQVYSVQVLWFGAYRPVLVVAVGNEPLIGM